MDPKAKRARKGRELIEREERIRKARMSEASTKVVGMLFMERGRGLRGKVRARARARAWGLMRED